MQMKFFPTRAAALTMSALLLVAACGSDDTGSAAADGSTASSLAANPASSSTGVAVTTTVDTSPLDSSTADSSPATDESLPGTDAAPTSAGATDPDAPQRIISLSPSATETLFAVGAGDQVIAVDALSTYPEEALAVVTDLSGYTPNVEAIAAYEPDLVIHDGTQDLSTLEGLGIEQLASTAPDAFDDVYVRIEEIGAVTGHSEEAARVVEDMQSDVEAAIGSVEVLFEVPPRIYHELDDTLFSINSNTFIGQVYSLFGLQNIADTAEGSTPYLQLNAEFVISQNPDVIFLADAQCCGQSPETVAARPGWGEITAVQAGNVIPVDEDVASRWGPRIVEYVEFVAATINDLGEPSGG
jgi:iron complex transport system substrate-binding protein